MRHACSKTPLTGSQSTQQPTTAGTTDSLPPAPGTHLAQRLLRLLVGCGGRVCPDAAHLADVAPVLAQDGALAAAGHGLGVEVAMELLQGREVVVVGGEGGVDA
jgi:hypothetical protein